VNSSFCISNFLRQCIFAAYNIRYTAARQVKAKRRLSTAAVMPSFVQSTAPTTTKSSAGWRPPIFNTKIVTTAPSYIPSTTIITIPTYSPTSATTGAPTYDLASAIDGLLSLSTEQMNLKHLVQCLIHLQGKSYNCIA